MQENVNEKFWTLREKYPNFIFEDYKIIDNDDNIEITYNFEIPSLEEFNPKIVIPKTFIKRDKIDKEFLEYLAFNIGVAEAISYYKTTCSKHIIIKCGYLDKNQINWFKKLYYNGLGEFLYRNNIDVDIDDFFDIIIDNKGEIFKKRSFESDGNLINIGGGKDSCVSLKILENEKNNACFLMNPKKPMIECAKVAGYSDEDIYCVNRIIDKDKIVKLNKMDFLNGHIPISSIIAFISYLVAYLSGKQNIILSNESSANESYVKGKKVNHQYSKSFEFEMDFYNYTTTYFSNDIKYFSLLRPLKELQIADIFSNLKEYHHIFKSCNLGSKGEKWDWCLNCSKCLFIYLILNPFLSEEELINIFGENLLNKETLLNDFIGLIGDSINKPFECVGTYEEINYAINKTIQKYFDSHKKLPNLLQYYYEKHGIVLVDNSILNEFNEDNNLDEHYKKLVKEIINYEQSNGIFRR